MLTLGPECVPPGRQEGKPDRKGKLFVGSILMGLVNQRLQAF